STGPGGSGGNGANNAVVFGGSSDLSHVFFTTGEKLASGSDTDSQADVYDAHAGTVTWVSQGAGGMGLEGNGAYATDVDAASADGSHVFFYTKHTLVNTDFDGGVDVYERTGGVTKHVSMGTGNPNSGVDATYVGNSADGSHAYFTTFEATNTGD